MSITESEAVKKAIRHFECMKNDAVVVLDSGFGTRKGESDLLYRNRKMYAELAINALEKQIPIKHHHTKVYEVKDNIRLSICPSCLYGILNSQFDYPKYCTNCGQAIDWSDEELKELREKPKSIPIANIKFSKDMMQELVDKKVKEIELDIQAIRNKAIDDAMEKSAEAICVDCGYLKETKCTYTGSNCGVSKPMLDSVMKALEQLKAGVKE